MERMALARDMRSLPRQIWQLGWISFFADVCSEMAYPVLALFMVAIGQGPAALGVVEGISEAIVSFMKAASGVRTDQTGKRVPFIQAGYALTAVGKPIIGLARAWPIVLVGRSLDRFGKGIRTTARDTLIVDVAGKTRLGAAFGLHRALDTAGALTGVLATLLLLSVLPSISERLGYGRLAEADLYRWVFLLAFIPGLISVLLTLRIREAGEGAGEPKPTDRPKFKLSSMPAGYWRAVAITTVFAIANSSDTFLILRAQQGFQASAGFAGAAVVAIWGYALYNVVYTLASFPAGVLSDRIGRRWVLAAGWLVYAAVYAGFALTAGPMVWVLFAAYGLYIGMTDGVSKALVADFSPKEARGTAMGFFYMVTGFATLLASGIMGMLYSSKGPTVAFGFGSATALLAVLCIALFGSALGRPQSAS